MPKDKTQSHELVIKARREEFAAYGFKDASMRRIGERAGMTAAGLYRHFKSKEDMFDELVRPALDDIICLWKREERTSGKTARST